MVNILINKREIWTQRQISKEEIQGEDIRRAPSMSQAMPDSRSSERSIGQIVPLRSHRMEPC